MTMLIPAPALEAAIPIIKKFEPEPTFQMESSDDLEVAWQELLGRKLRPQSTLYVRS